MRSGRLFALLVVLVLSISVAAPPAFSTTWVLEHDSLRGTGEVDSWSYKGEGSSSTGDDDRWGGPDGNGEEDDVPSDGGEDDEEDDERPMSSGLRGRVLRWFVLGNWLVL
jgi:hypothetical protein